LLSRPSSFVVSSKSIPFQDGNGRPSRILTALLLLRAGYAYVPYSSLESVIEHSEEGYYVALRKTQGTIRTDVPNWQPWVLFFLRALQQQMKRLAEKIERERIVLSAIPELSVQIVEYAREHGRVTIGDMVALTVSGHLRKTSGCVALEPEDAARQILGKHSFGRCQQPLAAFALGEQLNPVKDFCLGD
jgi:hypothetical protein